MTDCFRLGVEINKYAWLESKQTMRNFQLDVIRSHDINALDKRNPWVAFFWSILFTGLGHIYTHKILLGLVLVGCTFATAYDTNLLIIIYTFAGTNFSIKFKHS